MLGSPAASVIGSTDASWLVHIATSATKPPSAAWRAQPAAVLGSFAVSQSVTSIGRPPIPPDALISFAAATAPSPMKSPAVGPDRSEMTITFTGGPIRATVVVVAAGADDDADDDAVL